LLVPDLIDAEHADEKREAVTCYGRHAIERRRRGGVLLEFSFDNNA
jgi:hypothetical protein